MKTIRLVLLVLVAFAFTSPADVKLEYTFKVGDEYTWSQLTKQTIKQSFGGMEQNIENNIEGEMNLKVKALTPNGAEIETTFTRLKHTMTSPQMNSVMDSEGADDKMENKIFKALLNKPFSLFLTKLGKIEKVENMENLWSGLSGLGLDENELAARKQSLQQMFGESAIKSGFEQAFVTYPENKVKPGDTWKVTVTPPMNFPLSLENTWSFTGVEGNAAKLTADGVATTSDKEKAISLPGGLKAKIDLGGKQAMKSSIDTKSGWPTKLDMMSELKGKMILLAGGPIPEDMDIPMEIFSENSFTMKKK
ncbi:MAG TPA: DUF6263 family protein [Ohtaekwangia sp.]|nr:DUF6263 family protein [Ohtaekwangia sp.]